MVRLAKSTASLRLFSDDLDPDEISRLLCAPPTMASRKGDARESGGRSILAKTGSWRLKADDRAPGDLDSQVSELLQGLTDDLETWRRLSGRFQLDLFCGLFMERRNEGLALSPATLKMLSDRGITLSLDIYDPAPEGGRKG